MPITCHNKHTHGLDHFRNDTNRTSEVSAIVTSLVMSLGFTMNQFITITRLSLV